jgi:hypothetical protein
VRARQRHILYLGILEWPCSLLKADARCLLKADARSLLKADARQSAEQFEGNRGEEFNFVRLVGGIEV